MAYNALGGGTLGDMASAELANYMPSTWAKKTLDFVMKELQAFKCIDRSYELDINKQGAGDTLVINPLLEISAAAVNTDAAPSAYMTDQGTPVSLIINMWYEAVVGINDAQGLMGSPDYETRVIPKLAYAIAKQIDVNTNRLFNAFDNAAGTEGEALTYDTLLAAKAYLDIADAPQEDRFLFIDPESLTDLMQDDMFTSALYKGESAVAKGFIGQQKALGCTVYMSTNLMEINTNYHAAAMFHREAIIGALRQNVKTATWREEDRHTTYHRASAIWGLIEARGTFGVRVLTRS